MKPVNSQTNALSKLERHPYIFVLFVLIVYVLYYLSGVHIHSSIFADGVGKWMQIQALIQNGLGNLSCLYNEQLDPTRELIPGPWYFYGQVNGDCIYGYQFPYALLVALAAPISVSYSYYIVNFIFLVLYVLAFMRLGKLVLPEIKYIEHISGCLAFLIIPIATFSFDVSEITLSMAMGAWVVYLSYKALNHSSKLKLKFIFLFSAGIIAGLLFALRTESTIFSFFVGIAIFVVVFENNLRAPLKKNLSTEQIFNGIRISLGEPFYFTIGYILSMGIVLFLQEYFLGNMLGLRGASHSQITSNQSLITHLDNARVLLFGTKASSNLGLFSALPTILIIVFVFFNPFRKLVLNKSLFFLVIAIPTTVFIIFLAPNDAGYSWSPRYLTLTFMPYYIVVLSICFADIKLLKNWLILTLMGISVLYSLNYTHKGMRVVQNSSRQNGVYNKIIKQQNPDFIVIDHPVVMGILNRDHLKMRVLQVDDDRKMRLFLKILRAETKTDHNKKKMLFIGRNSISRFENILRTETGIHVQNEQSVIGLFFADLTY